MSSRTLNWPRRLARTERTPLIPGHGSFLLRRVHLGSEAFDRQKIKLTGYLLVVVREGSVILDRADSSLLLQEGDAALVPPGRFALTEIPRPRFTRGEVLLYFFNQRALAELMTGRERLDELAARLTMPALPFYPVQRVGAALDAFLAVGALKSLADLRTVFAVMLNQRVAVVANFLKYEYYLPRLHLCLFLEGQCRGKVDIKRIAARYPHGAAAFRRDCANYLGMPAEQWLFRRRVELAHGWLRYSPATEHEVAGRLGYDDMQQLRADLKRRGGFSPLELAVLRLLHPLEPTAQVQLPFWYPDGEARAEKEQRLYSDFTTLHTTAPKPSDQKRLLRRYPPKEQGPPVMPVMPVTSAAQTNDGLDELAGQDDAPGNVISFEKLEAWQIGTSPLTAVLFPFALAA